MSNTFYSGFTLTGLYSKDPLYCIKEMKNTDEDYELIRKSIEDTTTENTQLKTDKIYRVTRRNVANDQQS